ncbi:LysR family transcriptional regulator [Paracoccaceae bacterium Fryx2]|nr:LysR family transcriptional regulator [Paracoccaceae bacterium Fryx2]
MIAPRRYLPSIPSLLALEALDRLGSASAVAEELSLTQSAISRQLQALEGQMQVQLLLRERKRLVLTPAAQDYARQVRHCLQQLAQASLTLRANPRGGSLNLAILPAFGMHWLAPRLARFAARHPEVTVNLSTRLRPFDFDAEPFHAAIHYGRQDWPGVEYLPLMAEVVVPVAAPGLLAGPVARAADLLAYPLLHLETRAYAWQRWMAAQGVVTAMPQGMLFDQFATMTQAAVHGLGVALLPDFLIGQDVAEGRLVIAHQSRSQSVGSYYLVWPKARAGVQPLVSFRDWIAAELVSQT